MEATATLRFARVSARKARLVADLVRGRDASEAIRILSFLPKKTGPLIRDLVEAAVANAEHKAQQAEQDLDIDNLYVKTIFVDQGPMLRRFRPRAQGRATPIRKNTSHITVIVETR